MNEILSTRLSDQCGMRLYNSPNIARKEAAFVTPNQMEALMADPGIFRFHYILCEVLATMISLDQIASSFYYCWMKSSVGPSK